MAKFKNVHIFFCEGPHDAAFLALLLRKMLGYSRTQLKISDTPFPFSNIFRTSMINRSAEDLRLDLAKRFFLPDFLLTRNDTLVMIFNSGGTSRRGELVAPFLADTFALGSVSSVFGEGPSSANVFYSIFTDADSTGSSLALEQISRDLSLISGQNWLNTEWAAFGDTRAVYQTTSNGPVSAYVWKHWSNDYGTLEDIILECFLNDGEIQQTFDFLDQRFSWVVQDQSKKKEVIALAAKRLKAAFCIGGQREKPGASLSVILDQTKLFSAEILEKSQSVRDCVKYLELWLNQDESVS